MQGLCDGFLDLAIALPLPPSLPPYSTTIILVTLVTRFALLPITVWGRRRVQRIEEVVIPQVEKLKPLVSRQVLEDMKKEGIRGDKETLQRIHTQRSVALLTAHRKELFAKHHCKPLPSMIIPPLSQLPFFVVTSVALGRLSVDPTPFDSESFLTLTTLAHPDPTMTLPIVLGVLTMANVESSNWLMSAAERERARRIEETNEKKRAELGNKARVIQPQKIVKSTLRFLSVARIVVAAMTPGSVALYWVSSAAFGLVQTWIMDWVDIRRRRKLELVAKPAVTDAVLPKIPLPKKIRR
ncbi:Membrane insertase OXA1/ALB3/YidC [Amanita muscaria]